MADTVVFFEDEGGMHFLDDSEAFTNDFSRAQRFAETQAVQLAQVLHEQYPQQVFEVGVML
jgi:uncharacterized protein YsxB (DUF464 family)